MALTSYLQVSLRSLGTSRDSITDSCCNAPISFPPRGNYDFEKRPIIKTQRNSVGKFSETMPSPHDARIDK